MSENSILDKYNTNCHQKDHDQGRQPSSRDLT